MTERRAEPEPASSPSVLVVEDDRALGPLLMDYLSENGFRTALERRGDCAVKRILGEPPDLVVLDIMLPGADGLTICRKVRPTFAGIIVMLTARGEEPDEVAGLDLGADDYVTKPVSPRILLARLRARLRRPGAPADRVAPLAVGAVRLDPKTREATACGRRLTLRASEFDVLELLLSHAGTVLDRRTMHELLRGGAYEDFDRSIDLRVARLRRKIAEATGGQALIKTVRGVGYLYEKW